MNNNIQNYKKHQIEEKLKQKENREQLKASRKILQESIKSKLTPQELKAIKFKE